MKGREGQEGQEGRRERGWTEIPQWIRTGTMGAQNRRWEEAKGMLCFIPLGTLALLSLTHSEVKTQE